MRKTALLLSLLFTLSLSAQSFEEAYRQFQQQAQQQYADFRETANRQYADFLRAAWEYYKAVPAIPQPKEDQVPPVVYNDDADDDAQNDKTVPVDKNVVTLPQPSPRPEPVAPVIENDDRSGHGEQTFTVCFYGTSVAVRCPNQGFKLHGTDADQLADAWETLSTDTYNNLLCDCLAARDRLQFCDWAYLCFLQTLAEQVCHKSNAAVFLQAFLYAQSGYQMRLAQDCQGMLYLLVGSRFMFYDRSYFHLDDGNFFPLADTSNLPDGLRICSSAFPREQPLSLHISAEQQFADKPSHLVARKAQSGLSAEVCVNSNLIDFYNHYPTGHYGDDFSTRWAVYANAPLDAAIRRQLYPPLRQAVRGVPELQAVNLLLNWVQTAFEYEYDDVVWGTDRAFFPAESLYYPYCDCEDRSILFSRLVRDLLGLEVILLYYPGHLATAVCFRQSVSGDCLTVDGKRFIVCDPTYIGAPVGATMPDMDNHTAKVIRLNN